MVTPSHTPWILAGLVGYVLGSVPFGMLLTRFTGAGDLRAIGSGNIGATNVLRTGRKGLAAATLLLDIAKGALAVLVARWIWGAWGSFPAQAAAAGAMLGHCFPVWLRGKGGKGVATMLGVSAGLAWQVGLIAAISWLLLARRTRISSVGGMGAAVAAPVTALALGRTTLVPLLTALALLVVLRHHANIARLLAGTETRIGQGK